MSGILITGASGFIGSAVLADLRERAFGRDVILAGRRAPAGSESNHWPLDLAAEELTLPSGIGVVLHLAGEKRDPDRMVQVNHLGAARLVDAAARAGVRRFVHLSSVGVYGAPKHSGLVNEAFPHAPRNAYEASKDAGERAVRQRCAALGLTCVVLQPSNVVGVVPGRSFPLLGLARMVGRGWFRHVGRGDAWSNYVPVEDVAAALVTAAIGEASDGVYIVNTPATLRSVVGWIAEELGVTVPQSRVPSWLGAAAAGLGGAGRVVLRRELPFSPERFLELTNTTRYDGGAITRDLGFGYPLGIEAAIRGMMRRYRTEGLVPSRPTS